nr:hypothetical protein [Tanacetum cinerariifolium]
MEMLGEVCGIDLVVFVINQCERRSANESEGRCQLGLGAQAHRYVLGRCKKGLGMVRVYGKGSGDERVWKLIDTPYRAMWDKAYLGFLGVRTTFDIFQNILLLYCKYDVLITILSIRRIDLSWIRRIGLYVFVVSCEV